MSPRRTRGTRAKVATSTRSTTLAAVANNGEDEYLRWLRRLNEELGEPSAEAYEWARQSLECLSP
jgi:hypothetical protein